MTRKRCPVCNGRLAKRFCTSRNEDICTRCCGIMRSKTGCPRECEFAVKTLARGTLSGREVEVQQTYFDTVKEMKESMRQEMEAWCDKPCKALGGKTPMEVSKTRKGRKKLREMFAEMEARNEEMVVHGSELIDYSPAKVRLGLGKPRTPTERELDFEETVEAFIKGARDGREEIMEMVSQELNAMGIAEAFSEIDGFDVTRSALSDCGNFALVEVEAWYEDYSTPPETFELEKKEVGWRIIEHMDTDIKSVIHSR